MSLALLSIILTALLTAALMSAIAWFVFDRVIREKLEAQFAEKADALATLIKLRVEEGVTEAIEKHRDDVAAEVEDRVKTGVVAGIEEGVASLRASLVAKASAQASKSGVELMADALDMWLKNPLRWRP